MSRGARARARAQKPGPPISRLQAARAGNTRFTRNRDVARRARARAQKPGPPISRLQAARAGNTRFTHNQDVARRARAPRVRARAKPGSPITKVARRARGARAKTGSAHLKVAGGARGQYPVHP